MTDKELEELGKDVAGNTHLFEVNISRAALNDHRISILFRGLTRSNSIKFMTLMDNGLSAVGVRSMVPFLQNAYNLTYLDLDDNNVQSEGFSLLFRALRDSHVEQLCCNKCDIASMEIDNENKPKHLKNLFLNRNGIDTNGCRELVKLLQGGDATLDSLSLENNNIDDEGVEILVDALQSNRILRTLDLRGNGKISKQGEIMLLKLVNDISCIEATLQSNHTLKYLLCADDQIQKDIDDAVNTNLRNANNPEAAGRAKVIQTQLHSETRAKLAEMQGVDHSVYSEINPLHLPEVLALVGSHHGQGELYLALKCSIAGIISTVNRKRCIEVQMAYHASKLEELGAELAAIKAAKGGRAEDGESRSIKRRRKWWWGLWRR